MMKSLVVFNLALTILGTNTLGLLTSMPTHYGLGEVLPIVEHVEPIKVEDIKNVEVAVTTAKPIAVEPVENVEPTKVEAIKKVEVIAPTTEALVKDEPVESVEPVKKVEPVENVEPTKVEVVKNVEPVTPTTEPIKDELTQMIEKVINAKESNEMKAKQLMELPHKLIEIEMNHYNDEGTWWYDKNAEFEPNIFVDWASMEEWGLENYEAGDMVTGIFDSEGWELFGFIK